MSRLASAVYEGTVEHRRHAPRPHAFRYRLFMMYLDLEELPLLFRGIPGWSARGPAPFWFRRADYLGPRELPLDEAVRRRTEELTGRRPRGPVRVLTHLRTWGYVFNPVSFYYLFEPGEDRPRQVLAQITNTPWGERHEYVVETPEGESGRFTGTRFPKRFHVSPFLPMDMEYRWTLEPPGAALRVHMENHRGGKRVFDATLDLRRREITRPGLLALPLRHPLMTVRVIAGIHLQALRLWRKAIPFHPHPRKLPAANGGAP